ncbi:MAG: DsbA family protein [Chloroflexi bacterium AL-W]|nr:DsbA family protein [Chloroflexi bacterium AL-N1]NOK66135.1 DsbA family protein [Chloroflexi bacterium AL-N10]NOK73016.1 DsbA family protein [Chloroflexi bacterium AL-N5]NOK79913.1 DsbA family protein [Chloroflexi bacterium AL-W]NOK88231.1 DsbA family protein [Chloroflexi bacterium AL-N15]
MPQITEQYIETGQLYVIYRDFPLPSIHPSAVLAAHVANCAAEQDTFWPMHDRIFAGFDAREWGSGVEADFATFLGYADELAIDTNTLNDCVRTNRHASQIETDFNGGAEQGVRSTPSFTINDQLVVGAQPFPFWQEQFDAILGQ